MDFDHPLGGQTRSWLEILQLEVALTDSDSIQEQIKNWTILMVCQFSVRTITEEDHIVFR